MRTQFAPKRSRAPRWISSRFAAQTRIGQRAIGAHEDERFTSRAWKWQFGLLSEAISITGACYYRDMAAIDVAYPFLDRRVVEFLMAIPSDEKVSPTEMRAVQRNAMRGILPELVRIRTSKAGQGEVMCRAIARQWPAVRELVGDSRLVKMGCIDQTEFDEELLRAKHGMTDSVQPICRALVLEAWLRTHPERSLTRTNQSASAVLV